MIPTSEEVNDIEQRYGPAPLIRTAQHKATLASLTPEGDVVEAAAKAMYESHRANEGKDWVLGSWEGLDEKAKEYYRINLRAAAPLLVAKERQERNAVIDIANGTTALYRRKLEAAEAEVERLRKGLERMATYTASGRCPVCNGKDAHDKDCWLRALLEAR